MAIIQDLLNKGYSKYYLARQFGVSWNTIQSWHKGKSAPSKKRGLKTLVIYQMLMENELVKTPLKT